MRVILLRVKKSEAFLKQDRSALAAIGRGMVVFVGIANKDTSSNLEIMAEKIANLRIFEDASGKLNYSIKDKNYEILCVPNFILCANTKKGRRPSFENAMPQDTAEKMFEDFLLLLKARNLNIRSGEFKKDMIINLDCDGPVNIIIDV